MDTTLLNYFWQLASLDAEERQNAAKDLIIHLHKSFQEFAKSEKVPDINDIRDFSRAIETIKKVGGPDVAYAMLRLTKGITSPRAGARHGFALALTELLASFEFFTFKMILPLIDKHCPITSSKDKEGSDKVFGRVLSFVSVMKSGILWRETSSDEDYCKVINSLLACASCKPYVREACYQIIVSSIPLLKKTSFDEKAISHLIMVMKERSDKSGGINNPDDINFALAIEAQYPDIIQSNQWKQVMVHSDDLCTVKWHEPHILHPNNLEKLAEAIQAKSSKSATEIQQNQESRIHSVWDTILCLIISPPNDKPGKQTVTFEQFWKAVVDECLFDSDSTHQRKFWGFQLFEKALKLCPDENISSLFTPNFMRTLINNSHEKNRYLHEAAIRSLKVIEQVSNENHRKALVIVKQFLGQYYDQDFDKASANIVKKILSLVNNQTIEEYVLYLKSIFIQPNENLSSDSDTTEQRRQWIINYLYSLIKDSRISRQEGWLRLVLELFLLYGFYVAKNSFLDDNPKNDKVEMGSQSKRLKRHDTKRVRFEDQQNSEDSSNTDNSQKKTTEYILPKPRISESTQVCCRTRFFHALGELSTFRSLRNDKTEKPSRTRGGFKSDDQTWAFYAVTLMNTFENDNQLEPLIVLNEEAVRLKKAAVELLQKITKKLEKLRSEGSQNSNLYIQQEGFHWLFSYVILTLYTEPEEAMNALEDLQVCFNRMFAQSKRSPKKKKNEENIEENHDPIDVIVDVLLSFLAKPSAFLHSMTEQAFKVFCSGITKSSLDLMLDLISKKGNVEEELVDEMDIDEENNDDDSYDESDEHDSDNDETDSEKKEVKDQPTIEVGQRDKQDKNEDNNEDETNQDRIMEEFDSKLSEFFRQKKFEKKKRKDAKYQRIHYKHKVIGLLKIFVKEQQNNPLIFELIVPLLEISKNAKTDEIAKSAFDLLSAKIIVIKDGPIEFDENKVLALLEKVQDMARKSRSGDIMKLCWDSSAFLLKSIVRRYNGNTSGEITNQHIKKAIAIYELTYKSWCVKSNSLNIKCFSQLPNHIPQIPWYLSEIFLGCADPKTAKNPKKVMNAYDVSFSILNIALPKKNRESENADGIATKLVPKIRETLNNTFQFVAEDLKCGNQNFDSQTLKSILKFASLAIKRTSIEIPIEERKKLWNARNFLLLLEKIKELPRFKSSQAISGLVKEITHNFK